MAAVAGGPPGKYSQSVGLWEGSGCVVYGRMRMWLLKQGSRQQQPCPIQVSGLQPDAFSGAVFLVILSLGTA